MSAAKRIGALVVALVTAALALVAFDTTAGAAPYSTQPTISVSTTNPPVGGTLTVSGSGFTPNGQVSLTLHTTTYSLGTATADASGSFTASVTLPAGVSGSHTIVATDVAGRTASVAICIGTCQAAGSGSGTGGGGLSATGVAVAGMGALGLVLLAGGGLLLLAGRRRNAAVR